MHKTTAAKTMLPRRFRERPLPLPHATTHKNDCCARVHHLFTSQAGSLLAISATDVQQAVHTSRSVGLVKSYSDGMHIWA